MQFPGNKERPPVNIWHDLRQVIAVENLGARKSRRHRPEGRPVDLYFVFLRQAEGEVLLNGLLIGKIFL